MPNIRTTFTLDEYLTEQARLLNINIPAADQQGTADAVRAALTRSDRDAYQRIQEEPDPFWDKAEEWNTE